MIAVELIALLATPIFGVLAQRLFRPLDAKEIFINFCALVVLSNLLTHAVLYVFWGSETYSFSVLFFLKYSVLNIVAAVLIALAGVALGSVFKTQAEVHQHDET